MRHDGAGHVLATGVKQTMLRGDTTAQKWLSPEWSEVVSYTKHYADEIGMSCDFTFGSAWPTASSNIRNEESTQIYGDSSFKQLLTFAWTWPDTQLVL